ncbi:hypothetical protein ACXWRS_11930, partial [Streptococcus pyogenes]
LSGGEQPRIGIVRALLSPPPLLFLSAPFSSFSPLSLPPFPSFLFLLPPSFSLPLFFFPPSLSSSLPFFSLFSLFPSFS